MRYKGLLSGVGLITSTALLAHLAFALAFADSSDHIGPDPIQSENCITITPGRSVACVGQFLGQHGDVPPQVVINCGPGIFVLLLHEPRRVEGSLRRVRLHTVDSSFSGEWLAISASQSAFLTFDGGQGVQDYRRMIQLVGLLVTPGSSHFAYAFGDEEIEGFFEFGYSDRHLIEQLSSRC